MIAAEWSPGQPRGLARAKFLGPSSHAIQRQDEDKLKQITASWEKKKQDVDAATKRLTKSQDELNQLNITLRQVEEYNDQMKAEIQVTRRATYKAEDHIKQIEKQKHKQDLLIDTMNEDFCMPVLVELLCLQRLWCLVRIGKLLVSVMFCRATLRATSTIQIDSLKRLREGTLDKRACNVTCCWDAGRCANTNGQV